MKQQPKVHSDSFWADLANALALRPVHREPLHQPTEPPGEPATLDVATAEVSLDQSAQQSASHSSSSPVTPVSDEEVAAPRHYGNEVWSTSPAQQNAEEPKVKPAPEASKSPEDTQTTETAEQSWRVSGVTAATQDEAVRQVKELLTEQRTHPHSTEAETTFVSSREALWNFEKVRGTSSAGDKPSEENKYVIDAELSGSVVEDISGATSSPVQYIAPENIRYSTTPEVNLVDGVITPVTSKSLQPDLSIRRRLRQVLKPSGQKLDRRQLKDLGLSAQEAAVAEGLFKGWNVYRIAMRNGLTQPRVNAVVKHMMTKFDVKQTHSLLKVLLAMHQDRKPTGGTPRNSSSGSRTTNIAGAVLKLEDAAYPVIIPKPPILRIPKDHPDHPLNDKGYGYRPKSQTEPKREPAHRSDESDPDL